MVQSQYSLTWDSYHTNLSKGFSSLQQNGAFVDMTLAADGYFVKVHQVLMALASPYLKDLLSSTPCQHPVVFLNNVSHKTLACLLEYIYTGEVLVAADSLPAFTDAAKALCIKGLENITSSDCMNIKIASNMSQVEGAGLSHATGIKRMVVPSSQRSEQIYLPAAARKICLKKGTSVMNLPEVSNIQTGQDPNIGKDEVNEYEEMDDCIVHDSDEEIREKPSTNLDLKNTEISAVTPTANLQFSVSIRGSLQLILNRYIYNLLSQRAGVKRWRCVDYRNRKCFAYVLTKDNVVLSRANLHNHSFHDKKILSKIEKKCVYSALEDVKGYDKEKAENMPSTDFISMDYFSNISDKSSDFKDT